MMNRDWLEKQAAKRAAQEAAERAVAEQQAAQEAAEAAGVAYKRGRGRPVGSKTKNHHRGAGMADLPPAETAQEVGKVGVPAKWGSRQGQCGAPELYCVVRWCGCLLRVQKKRDALHPP